MPRRENLHEMNVFDKPSAEPSLLELCRGEKRCKKLNVFDKPSTEPSLLELCRGEKRCKNSNDKNSSPPTRNGRGHGFCQCGRVDSAIRCRRPNGASSAFHPRLDRGCDAPSEHPIQRLHIKSCRGLPRPCGHGSLAGCRRERLRVVLVDLCVRQYQRGQHGLQRDVGEPPECEQPLQRFFRALRPASMRKLLFIQKYDTENGLSPRAAQATVCAGAVEQIPQSADGAPHDCCQLFIPDRTGATREALRNAQSSDCCLLLRATATVTAEP